MEIIHESLTQIVLFSKGYEAGIRRLVEPVKSGLFLLTSMIVGYFVVALIVAIVIFFLEASSLEVSSLEISFPSKETIKFIFALSGVLGVPGLLVGGLILQATLPDERLIIDKRLGLIRLQLIKKGRVKAETVYDISTIEGITARTDSYNDLEVRLYLKVEKDKSSYIIVTSGSLEETKDHRKKLNLAYRLAEFINIPVVEC